MKDHGLITYFLGLAVSIKKKKMFVHQWKYFNETDINGQGTNRLA